MIRIFVADEQAVVREGVKRIAGETMDLFVVGEAGNNHEVLSNLAAQACDVVLMDLSLTGRGGLKCSKKSELGILASPSWSLAPTPNTITSHVRSKLVQPAISPKTVPQRNWPPRSVKSHRAGAMWIP